MQQIIKLWVWQLYVAVMLKGSNLKAVYLIYMLVEESGWILPFYRCYFSCVVVIMAILGWVGGFGGYSVVLLNKGGGYFFTKLSEGFINESIWH